VRPATRPVRRPDPTQSRSTKLIASERAALTGGSLLEVVHGCSGSRPPESNSQLLALSAGEE